MSRAKWQMAGQLLLCEREIVSSSTFRHAASGWSVRRLRSLPALPIGRSLLRAIRVASLPSTGPWFRQPLTEPSPNHDFTPGGRIRFHHKDLGIALEASRIYRLTHYSNQP